jgi:alcohol dehydrogenase class IV
MHAYDFRAVNYPVRLYSGQDAAANIKAEVARNRGKRAFIVCGRTVSRKTALIDRMRERLGELCAGVYDEMEKDSTLEPILAARDAAQMQRSVPHRFHRPRVAAPLRRARH